MVGSWWTCRVRKELRVPRPPGKTFIVQASHVEARRSGRGANRRNRRAHGKHPKHRCITVLQSKPIAPPTPRWQIGWIREELGKYLAASQALVVQADHVQTGRSWRETQRGNWGARRKCVRP